MLWLPGFGRPGGQVGARWISLVIVLGVAGMHGLGLLVGCAGGQGARRRRLPGMHQRGSIVGR